ATERSAKNPPTTTTTIATSVPATKRATAELVLGGSACAPDMARSSLTRGRSGHPTYVALTAGPPEADSVDHDNATPHHPRPRRLRRGDRPLRHRRRQAWWRRQHRPRHLLQGRDLQAQGQPRRRPPGERVRGRPEPK